MRKNSNFSRDSQFYLDIFTFSMESLERKLQMTHIN